MGQFVGRAGRTLKGYLQAPSSIVQGGSNLFEMPERLKGGRIEKVFRFWNDVRVDYARTVGDIVQSCRIKPFRAGLVGSLTAGSVFAANTNPSMTNFEDCVVEARDDLAIIPESHRNPASLEREIRVSKAMALGLLKRWDLGLMCLIWEDDFPDGQSTPSSNCKYLKVGYLDFAATARHRIVDVGFLGSWWMTKVAMKDYDVRPEEWDEDGRPKNRDSQIRLMW